MHTSEASSPAKNRQGTSKTLQRPPTHMINKHVYSSVTCRLQPIIHKTIMCFVFFSYKVPAKGDGVDYVRTEDEVGREPYFSHLQMMLLKENVVQFNSPISIKVKVEKSI